MKKLYALAAALVATVSVNAQVYVTGQGDGLGWDAENPLEVTAGTDGNYTFTVNNLSEMKMSTAKGSWDDFNAGCLYCEPTAATLGTPIAIEKGNQSNVRTPWTGDYTITISSDYSQATFTTTTPKPVEKFDIYLRGDMNGWGTDDAWKFQTEDYIHYSLTCKITAGQNFKVADANWGPINFGGAQINDYGTFDFWYNSGDNSSVSFDYEGTIEFTLEDSRQNPLPVTFVEPPFEEPGVTYVINSNLLNPKTYSDTPMTLVGNGNWELADFYTDGGTFRIRRYDNGTLDEVIARPADEPTIPATGAVCPTTTEANAPGWYLSRGYYTIKYSAKNKTITVTGNVYPAEYEIPAELFILGNVDGYNWATDEGVATIKDGNVFTAEGVTVNPSGEGSEVGYFSLVPALGADWDEINANDRYGAAVENAPITLGEPSMMFIYRADQEDSKQCKSWEVAAGEYDITIDFDAMTVTVVKAGTGSVSDVLAGEDIPAVYYNLQGVRVNNPAKGLYIEVRGNSARKVLLAE